ncbi:hypothetical protein [Cloacibacterium sp.]
MKKGLKATPSPFSKATAFSALFFAETANGMPIPTRTAPTPAQAQ